MIRPIYFVLLSLISMACQSQGAIKIDSEKLKELQSDGIMVVDIRTPGEFADGHIPGVKLNIDYRNTDFISKMDELDKSKPIIIHCRSGGRSGRAAPMLIDAGFETVYDYSGGMIDWINRGEEIEK